MLMFRNEDVHMLLPDSLRVQQLQAKTVVPLPVHSARLQWDGLVVSWFSTELPADLVGSSPRPRMLGQILAGVTNARAGAAYE